ncbi:MAG: hypothetical protein ACI9YH_000413 [Colwellia sp.]|jgi:hypothetical protein
MLLPAQGGTFYIQGDGAKAISLSLGVSSIDFGDVYKDSQLDSVPVDFYVNAAADYYYRVEISNDDSTGVVQMSRSLSTGYTVDSISYIETANGSEQRHDFYVDLATGRMSGDLSATITVMVVYQSID